MILTKETSKGILHYSDQNMKLRQVETGIIYSTADDIVPCPYTYEETDEPIPVREERRPNDLHTFAV